VIEVQEHIQLQVGTKIAFYEKCSDTGVTLSPSLQQPLALKSNGKPNLCKLQRLCAAQYVRGSSMFSVRVSMLWNVV